MMRYVTSFFSVAKFLARVKPIACEISTLEDFIKPRPREEGTSLPTSLTSQREEQSFTQEPARRPIMVRTPEFMEVWWGFSQGYLLGNLVNIIIIIIVIIHVNSY